jgi:hypothetical protein
MGVDFPDERLREAFMALTEKLDRAEIEAQIMRECACQTREIAVKYGFQVVPKSQAYEPIKALLENRAALEAEISKRLEAKRAREAKALEKREEGEEEDADE